MRVYITVIAILSFGFPIGCALLPFSVIVSVATMVMGICFDYALVRRARPGQEIVLAGDRTFQAPFLKLALATQFAGNLLILGIVAFFFVSLLGQKQIGGGILAASLLMSHVYRAREKYSLATLALAEPKQKPSGDEK